MFRKGEEQAIEDSSDEERGRTPQESEEDDSEEIPLSQLRGRSQLEGGEAGDDEEMEDPEVEWSKAAQSKVMQEAQACNLQLGQKCCDEVGRIRASMSKGGAALMSGPSIKASKKLRAQKKSQQQKKGEEKGKSPLLQARNKGSAGDKEVSKIHRVPYQKTSIPEVSVRDSTRF